MLKSEIYKTTVTLILFWWFSLTIYSVYESGRSWSTAFLSWKYVFFAVLFAIASAVGVVLFIITNRKSLANESTTLTPKGLNMKTTLGPTPAWLQPPKMSALEQVPNMPKAIVMAIAHMGKKDKRYQTLAIDLLRVLANNPKAPASPYDTGHGNASLFDHTIHVALSVLEAAANYSYTGLYSPSGKLIVGLRDINYKFDAGDPLILIAALAHDIGKLDAFIIKNKKIVGLKKNHDTLSMLMLARMPALNALDFAEQRVLLGAVGYYHSPQSLPLDFAGRTCDDRTTAIMELLHRCDIDSSSAEDLEKASAEILKIQIKTARDKNLSDDEIWNAFCTLVNEPGRVNGTSGATNVGQKWESDIYFHEEKTNREIIRILGIPTPPKRGDGTNPITIRLLNILLNRDILVNVFNNREYGPARALFEVKFFDPQNGSEAGHWAASFIVRPDEQLKHLAQMKTHNAIAVIQRPLMGEHSARNKKGKREDENAASDTASTDTTEKTVTTAESAVDVPTGTAQGSEGIPKPEATTVTADAEYKTAEQGAPVVDTPKSADIREEQGSPEEIAHHPDPGNPPAIPVESTENHASNPDEAQVEMSQADSAIEDNGSMYSMCDTEKEAREEQARRDAIRAEKEAAARAEKERRLPFAVKNQLASLDQSIENGGVDEFMAQTDPAKKQKKQKSVDAALASSYICNLWRKNNGQMGFAFKLGGNPNNLYVDREWLHRNHGHKFDWEDMIEQGLLKRNSDPNDPGKVFIKFDLSQY